LFVKLNEKFIFIDFADAGFDASAAAGTGFRIKFFRFPYILTHISVPEPVR
jgi:hypothetical protein